MPYFITGGVERVLVAYLNELYQTNHYDLSVIFTDYVDDCFLFRQFNPDIPKIFLKVVPSLKPPSLWGRKKRKIKKFIFKIYNYFLLKKHLRSADILVDFKNGEVLSSYQPLPHQKKIIWFHSSLETCQKMCKQKIIEKFSAIICLSEMFKKTCISLFPWTEGKIHVLYNQFDFEDIREKADQSDGITKEDMLLMGEPYFLHVSRIAPDKDLQTLLDGFAAFVKEIPKNIPKLYLIGEGKQRAQYQENIRKQGLNDVIKLVGEKDNPYPWMKNAQALILSSLNEGFGCVLIEALGCYTPVISSNCPSAIAEILENGQLGLLFKPGDANDLTEKLLDFYSGKYIPPTKDKINTSLTRFEKRNIIKKLIDILDSL